MGDVANANIFDKQIIEWINYLSTQTPVFETSWDGYEVKLFKFESYYIQSIIKSQKLNGFLTEQSGNISVGYLKKELAKKENFLSLSRKFVRHNETGVSVLDILNVGTYYWEGQEVDQNTWEKNKSKRSFKKSVEKL